MISRDNAYKAGKKGVRISETLEEVVMELAIQEQRSLANMVNLLIHEAICYRKITQGGENEN